MDSNPLLSFDSSDAGTDAASRFLGVSTSSTHPGGVTLGSLAESFHSEDYDEVSELPNGRGDGRRGEQQASAFDQQQEKVRGEREREREDVRVLLQRQISRSDLKNQQLAANSRPTSSSPRPPVPVQARPPSAYLPPLPPPSFASPQSNTNNSINEESLLRELSMESKENSRSREILASSVNYERGGRGGAKGADKNRRKTGGERENSGGGSMTLREQEKVIDDLTKESFNLKIKIHFYEQRLEKLTPSHITAALQENITIKTEFREQYNKLRACQKLLKEGEGVILTLKEQRDEERERREEGEERAERAERECDELREGRGNDSRRERERGDTSENDTVLQLREELSDALEAKDEALGEKDDYRMELDKALDLIEELEDRIKNNASREKDESTTSGSSPRKMDRETRREVERLERSVEDLEADNDSLQSQLAAQIDIIAAREEEKDALKSGLESLQVEFDSLEEEKEKLALKAQGRRESIGEEERTREEMQEENDEFRDRLSSLALEIENLESDLGEKEQDIEKLLQDLEDKDTDHVNALEERDTEWRGEVEDARFKEEEAKGLLEEGQADIEELAEKIRELTVALEEKEADSQEIEALTQELQKLSDHTFRLETELDEKDAKISDLQIELENLDREVEEKQDLNDQVVFALKEKLTDTKSHLTELQLASTSELKSHRDKIDEMANRIAHLEEKSRADSVERRTLEDEADEFERELRKEQEERNLEQKNRRDSDARWQRNMEAKEADIRKLQDALNGLESESRKAGEDHTSNQFSLELELERIKGDLVRCEDDLEKERREMDQRDERARDREMRLANLNSENKELSAQLASQTQARLTITDKFDSAAKSLRDVQSQLSDAQDRLRAANDLRSSQRNSYNEEERYRKQVEERNILLLTVYQSIDRLGSDQSPRKGGQADPKPANFSVFHDRLLARLKSITFSQSAFERRTKDLEAKFTDQITSLKRQLESRLRQLDRFEISVKTATESQKQWRTRIQVKQTEVDAAKSTNTELQHQIASLRQQSSDSPGDSSLSSKLTALTTRASTAERKLAAYQAQLASAEVKLGEARVKVAVAEGKWEARLRELESRLRAAEEKLKRERQGAKERVAEMTQTVQELEGQLVGARRRDGQLGDVLSATEKNKRSHSS